MHSSDADLPELGVGLVYNSGIEPLLAAHPDLVAVLEIEPQTTWIESRDAAQPYVSRPEVEAHIAALPGTKLVHSIGTPVGGSVGAHAAQLPLLKQTIETLRAPWASEHLSFNLTPDFFTGFFLPPRQTEAGLEIYIDVIDRLRKTLGVPFAFETGVNYLRPRHDEIPDGEFVAAVADATSCGILLDLHNVYCNALNGRQSVQRFLADIPLDRVWELHVAGGFELEGFWLDAHSGRLPDALDRLCQEIVPALPRLKAIVFEVFSSFLPHVGLDATRQQLERLHEIWQLRRPVATIGRRPPQTWTAPAISDVGPAEWERALGAVVIGRSPASELERALAQDPGARLVTGLIKEFRASMVVAVYRMTSRLLMLALGPDVFRAFLEDFWSRTPPSQYAGTEADAFADYLEARQLRLPQLQAIMAFERATLATLRDGQTRIARFTVDPLPMLRALADGVLLENPGSPGEYEIEITGEGPVKVAGVDLDAAGQTFPFH